MRRNRDTHTQKGRAGGASNLRTAWAPLLFCFKKKDTWTASSTYIPNTLEFFSLSLLGLFTGSKKRTQTQKSRLQLRLITEHSDSRDVPHPLTKMTYAWQSYHLRRSFLMEESHPINRAMKQQTLDNDALIAALFTRFEIWNIYSTRISRMLETIFRQSRPVCGGLGCWGFFSAAKPLAIFIPTNTKSWLNLRIPRFSKMRAFPFRTGRRPVDALKKNTNPVNYHLWSVFLSSAFVLKSSNHYLSLFFMLRP